ncbi:hypothetical protein BEN74_04535 [Acinetobacter sp. WCHAc010034]|nr:hypothetical protein BEN74_04535 [Acinetobacter sp. WCHAc010034]
MIKFISRFDLMPPGGFSGILRMQECAACTACASCHLRQISCYFPRVLSNRAGSGLLRRGSERNK